MIVEAEAEIARQPTNSWKQKCRICGARYPQDGKPICGCRYVVIGSDIPKTKGRKKPHRGHFTKGYASGKR